MKNETKYTTDGKCSVWAGKIEIARAYVGFDGYEVRVKQGCPRMEVIERIFNECPDFAANNDMKRNIWPKLF